MLALRRYDEGSLRCPLSPVAAAVTQRERGVSIKRVYFISPKEKEFVIKDTDKKMKKSNGGELWTANKVFVKRFLPEV